MGIPAAIGDSEGSISFESDEMKAFRCGFTTADSNTTEVRDRVIMNCRVIGQLFEGGLLKCGVLAAKPTGNHINSGRHQLESQSAIHDVPTDQQSACHEEVTRPRAARRKAEIQFRTQPVNSTGDGDTAPCRIPTISFHLVLN